MAVGVSSDDLETYFREASSWDADLARQARASRRRAHLVAAGGVTVALLAIGFHIARPLRSVEPYVIRVDRNSGAVDVVTKVSGTKLITGNDAVSKYFLSQYVRSRESWIPAAAPDLFRRTALMSAPAEQERLVAATRPQNLDAPVNVYSHGETVGVVIRGVSFINDKVAQVQFSRVVQPSGALPPLTTDLIATINFKYAEKPVTEADRLDNPLGFEVVNYRADIEVPR